MQFLKQLTFLLIPGILFAGQGSAFNPEAVTNPTTVTILEQTPTSISVKCLFHNTVEPDSPASELKQSCTRWIMTDGNVIPVISEVRLNDGGELLAQSIGTTSESPVSVGEAIYQRGVRLVPVTFSPLAGEEAVNEITANITFPEINPKAPRLRRVIAEMWGDLILNRDFPHRDQDDEEETGAYVYVIPENNDVSETIAPLIEWRRQQGYPTYEIRAPEWADADFIYRQIINLDRPATPVDYILLAGDVDGAYRVPTFYRGIESDYFYSLFDDDDRIPDAAVGRISYNTISELRRIVTKILTYEQEPDLENVEWLRRAGVVAGSRMSGYSTILSSQWVREKMLAHDYTSVDTMWYTMGGTVTDFMNRQFNRGVNFITYRGWTGLEDWSPIQAAAMRNHYLPVAVLLACNSGDFARQQTGYTESLLRAPGGAISAIGVAGSQSRINFNNAMYASFFRGVLEDDMFSIGWALNRARLELMAQYGSQERELTFDHCTWTNLMGDPATIIWRGAPREVRVTAPQQIDYGTGSLTVTVVSADDDQPISGVRVGLSKEPDLAAAGYTNQNGRATIYFDNRRVTPGNALVTASGDKIVPSSTEVRLNRPNQYLVYQSANIVEDNNAPRSGDGDGIGEPNEVVGISVLVNNIGSSLIPSPTDCELSTQSDYCDIRVANFRIAQAINPNAGATAMFLVAFNSNFPDSENVPFTLTATNNMTEWTMDFNIQGRGARWDITYINLEDPPEPGDLPSFDIYLMNKGSVDLGITTARLISDSFDAEVMEANAQYDSMAVGETVSVGDVFAVSFDEGAAYGAEIPFHLSLSSEDGYTANLPFTIRMAELPNFEPTGPDDYGYYAFDPQDGRSNLRPAIDWEEINPRARGAGFNTGLLDQGEDDDESVLLDLPFPVKYYGEVFDKITVCSNGWAAFGDQTIFVDFRNMPIGSPQGPRAQLCPFWTDLYQPAVEAGVYYYYNEATHRFIIEWYRMNQWIGPDGPGARQTFEIVINDPKWYPNTTGDGDIYFVYQEVNIDGRVDAHSTPFATIGIGSPDDRHGLQLSFWNQFEPGVSAPFGGSAYRFVNAISHNYALLKGTVRVEGGDDTIEGAVVRAARGGWAVTDSLGVFRIPVLIAGVAQQAEVTADGFNATLSQEFNVARGDSTEIVVSLRQPMISANVEEVIDSLEIGEVTNHRISLRNPGNGDLSVTLRPVEHLFEQMIGRQKIAVPGRDDTDDFGENLLNIRATAESGDGRLLGVVFDGLNFVVSGGNNGELNNFLYKFDDDGRYLDRDDQPVADLWGMHDLAWDGTNLFGGVSEWIIKMERNGNEVSRILSPLIPARGLTIERTSGHFWITGEGQPILELDEEGEVVQSYSSHLNIYGLAWHPNDIDGMPLWIYSADGPTGLAVSKMDTATGEIRLVLNIEGRGGDRPGGIDITRNWNDKVWGLVALTQNATGDHVDVYDVGSNLSWISIDPTFDTIAANGSSDFTITLDSDGLFGGEYWSDVLISHNAIEGEMRIPVELYLEPNFAGVDPETPGSYSLESVYPNPSNGSAVIRFSLPSAGRTIVKIYDSEGRLVDQLIDQNLPAGYHREVFNAVTLPNGVYIVSLHSGNETFVQKFALVK